MKIKAALLLITSLSSFLSTGQADSRLWTDKNGTSIEAEYVSTSDGKLVLKKTNGTQLRVSIDTLSEQDQRYAVLLNPPRVDINVSLRTNRSNASYGNRRSSVQVTDETIIVSSTVRKSSSAPYEEPLRAELYLLGCRDNRDGYIILEKNTSGFLFTAENGSSHTFDSKEINLKQVDFGETRGVEYTGYLLAVFDDAGNIVDMKCSKLAFEKNAEAILGVGKGTIFDEDFKRVDSKKRPQSKRTEKKKRKWVIPGRRF